MSIFRQFLKFVEKTAPIAVYTSGKGSSAGGLMASLYRGIIARQVSVSHTEIWSVSLYRIYAANTKYYYCSGTITDIYSGSFTLQ